MKKVTRTQRVVASRAIMAADDEEFFSDEDLASDEDLSDMSYSDATSLSDDINELSDTVEDLQDTVDDVDEDDVDIDIDNNISGHYIAECDRCHGVFISAMIESDQAVEKISGTCPLCEKESDQYLKWIIKQVDE